MHIPTNIQELRILLKQLPQNEWSNIDTSLMTEMNSLFTTKTATLTDISSLSGWDTSNVTNMSNMFNDVNR